MLYQVVGFKRTRTVSFSFLRNDPWNSPSCKENLRPCVKVPTYAARRCLNITGGIIERV